MKRVALMGAIAATVASVGLTPTLANAASSQTYFVGFPDWLGIGEGAVLPSDPVAINNAIVAAKDDNPLIAWGLGPVDLKPVWVKWYTPVNPLDPTDPDQDQYYTPGEFGQIGSHQVTVNQDNPLFQPAYDQAFQGGYEVAKAAYIAQASADYANAAKNTTYARVYTQKYNEYIQKYCKVICNPNNPSGAIKTAADTFAKGEAGVAAGQAYVAALQAAANDPTIQAAAEAAGQAGGLAAVQTVLDNIPRTIEFTTDVPDFGWIKDGYWTTTTSGQWVAGPDDIAGLPTVGQLAYLANAVQNGDLSALAPVLNWTAYLSNVNLIAYGEGAIATGQAYQAYMDSVRGDTHDGYDPFAIGDPKTGPRSIKLTFGEGKVTITNTDTTNNPLEIPLPGDVQYPDAPPVGWENIQEGGVVDLTLLSLILVRNPGRANGGLFSRFAGIYEELTGVNPVTPDRQDVLPEGVDPEMITKLLTGNANDISIDDLGNIKAVIDSIDGKPIVVTLKADVGWEYDLMSDAPATPNPIAWANSLASSVFLTNLLTGVNFSNLGAGGSVGPDGTIYYTLPVDQLPLFAGQRLVAQALGLVTGIDIDTPIADALEPMAKILVNMAYTDVVRNADGTYTRSLDKFGDAALFGTRTLTREQMALVPGDLIAAAGLGVGGELSDILIRVKDQLVKLLSIQLTAEQNAALNQALSVPGNTIKDVARAVGDGVSQVATTVEKVLPDLPAPTQQQLSATQHDVGKALKPVADTAGSVIDAVKPAAGEPVTTSGNNNLTLNEQRDTANKATPGTTITDDTSSGSGSASTDAGQTPGTTSGGDTSSPGTGDASGNTSGNNDSGSNAA